MFKVIEKILLRILPARAGGGGYVSLMAKIVGNPKNFHIARGAFVHEYAMLYSKGPNSHLSLGKNSFINPYAKLHTHTGNINIGENSIVHSFCVLYGPGKGIKIGNHVRIGSHTSIISGNHGFGDSDKPLYEQEPTVRGIEIGDDVWIGVGSIILDGVHIGSHSVIGAGTIVSKDVPKNSIVVGLKSRENTIIPR